VFLVFAVVFGLSSVFLTPPLQVPDEHTHFYRAYDVSTGHLIARAPVVLPKTVTALQAEYPARLEIAWAEHRTLTLDDLFHSLREPLRPDDTVSVPSGHIYTFVPYLPSALGMWIARHLGASALGLLYSGRLCNLLVYICLVYWALVTLPAFRLPFLLVAAMPMSIQQAASLSADSLTISVTLLYLAVILAVDKPISPRQYGMMLLPAVVVLMAKANVVLALLPAIIPATYFGGRKRKIGLLAAFVLAAYLPFAVWQYFNRENIEAFRAVSLQAGVDIPTNIAFLEAHPLGFLRVLWRTCHEHWQDYLTGLVGVVGWGAARVPSWLMGLYLAVVAIVSVSEGQRSQLTGKQRWFLAGILVVSLLSVFVALWTLETQQRYATEALVVTSTTIANVQGRYFITILALAVLVVGIRTPWSISTRVSSSLATSMVLIAGITFWVITWQAYYKDASGQSVKPSLSNAGIVWGGFFLLQVEDSYSEGCRSFHFLNARVDKVPLVGDWNGDGRSKAGEYRKGDFYLDYDGKGQLDKVYHFVPNQAGDVPVVGDWNGDGRTKVGIFRGGFLWILDYNGDGKLDPPSATGDRVFGLGGIPMDLPVVGDWNGDGRSKAGIYRHGVWLLQSEDSLTSNVKYITQRFGYDLMEEGRDCDIPVVGDWNGDRKTKIGMLLVHNKGAGSRTYQWVLDRNGNGIFDDAVFDLGGVAGDVPLVWNLGRRQATVGVYRHADWMVRENDGGIAWHFGGLGHDVVVAGDRSMVRGGAAWALDAK
jgi:uncharacterized membrane protein